MRYINHNLWRGYAQFARSAQLQAPVSVRMPRSYKHVAARSPPR